jgi:hypothetical protein
MKRSTFIKRIAAGLTGLSIVPFAAAEVTKRTEQIEPPQLLQLAINGEQIEFDEGFRFQAFHQPQDDGVVDGWQRWKEGPRAIVITEKGFDWEKYLSELT